MTTRPLDHSTTLRRWLVRRGQLEFDDLLLLDAAGLRLALERIDAAGAREDLLLALNNTPRELLALRRAAPDRDFPFRTGAADEIHAAQSRIVELLALDLLIAKAPPLYDTLPWMEWDFGPVARRFQPWRTRYLLCGDGSTVTLERLRKTAGVAAIEPRPVLAEYIENKATLLKTKRFRLLPSALESSTPRTLAPFLTEPLPPAAQSAICYQQSAICSLQSAIRSASSSAQSAISNLQSAVCNASPSAPPFDLALLGSFSFALEPSLCALGAGAVRRLNPRLLEPFLPIPAILVIENNPLVPPLDAAQMRSLGFTPDTIAVRSLGPRPCWHRG